MKLTKDHIGKKVRKNYWTAGEYITLLGVNSDGVVSGIDEGGVAFFSDEDIGLFEWELISMPEQGLSLLEAMQSGKEFDNIDTYAKSYPYKVERGVVTCQGTKVYLDAFMLTARYVLKPEPKKVEVTADMLESAFWVAYHQAAMMSSNEVLTILKKQLGL